MESSTLHDIWRTQHSGDFAAGVQLIVRHNPKAVTPKMLTRLQAIAANPGEWITEYEQGKLENALRATVLPEQTPEQTPMPTAKPFTNHQSTNHQSTNQPITNQPITKLTSDTARGLHKLHSHHHALLVSAETDAQRSAEAHKIMREIIPALDNEYDRLRAKEQGGADDEQWIQAPILNASDNAVYQMRRLASLRTRIARLKNHLIPDAKTAKRKLELEKELAEKTAEKEQLEKELQ